MFNTCQMLPIWYSFIWYNFFLVIVILLHIKIILLYIIIDRYIRLYITCLITHNAK